ncbi:protein DEPP1 [Suricata suricatta]|uniref:DEPP1 autophagy regulator n=1 Tax=Suricata suricatta TaxID=37032 RepID=A0A673TAP5_SURSU|nr:protein DEPP1 [Suricata suricatta]XP_029788016.1 protein DEPP1 [Suricata suricatta]
MRSRLLAPVAHLPTIRETSEETLSGGPGQEPLGSPSLDDYVKSICQLAQPTSVLDTTAPRAQLSRPPQPAQAFEKSRPTESLQDITARFSGQQPAAPRGGVADPLDWLYGESREKQPSRRDPARQTGCSADPRGPHRHMDGGKARGTPRGRPCDARVQGHSLARPSRDWHQGSWPSRPFCGTAASPPLPRHSSTLRTLYLHLPVIHEL